MASRSDKGRKAERSGRLAEGLATGWLMLKGYRILARRLKNHGGEIDLIAKTLAGTVCFVEVKTRSDIGRAVAAVSPKQRARIAKAAEIFLQGQKPGAGARFDVICLTPFALRHIRDAWRPDDLAK